MSFSRSVLLKFIVIFLLAFTVMGCASNRLQSAGENSVPVEPNPDPFEGFNRKVHGFNMFFDRWLLKPVSKSYLWVAPEPVELGVNNFFGNLGEISNIVNSALQWKWGEAGKSTGRLLINTTLGLAGLFDVARPIGLEKSEGEDFGQTLAVWGVNSGPYLVLPFLGPSTIRDTASIPVDWTTNPVNHVNDDGWQLGLNAFDIVRSRAELLEVEELASGDFYIFVRDAYLQRRDFLVKDGAVEDDFSNDFDAEDFDF